MNAVLESNKYEIVISNATESSCKILEKFVSDFPLNDITTYAIQHMLRVHGDFDVKIRDDLDYRMISFVKDSNRIYKCIIAPVFGNED